MPLSLSDAELDALMSAAAPIPRHARDQFLRDCFAELAKFEVIGPGIIARVCSRLQRQHLTARRYAHTASKWDR